MRQPAHKPVKLWTQLRLFGLLFLTLSVTACGSGFRPSVRPSDVCLLIPAPDLDTDTRWMRDYAVTWSRLHCG